MWNMWIVLGKVLMDWGLEGLCDSVVDGCVDMEVLIVWWWGCGWLGYVVMLWFVLMLSDV